MKNKKILGHKSYGSIPHISGSRLGEMDHTCHIGQEKIALQKARDRHDTIIIQEKVDGSNCAVYKDKSGKIIPITRSGYHAKTSPFEQHHAFCDFVDTHEYAFSELLSCGERAVGEWLYMAHGTKYKIHEEKKLFLIFDIMIGHDRLPFLDVFERIARSRLYGPTVLSIGQPKPLKWVEENLTDGIEPAEGAVWRVERNGKFDFMVKYVRKDKVDGKYLDQGILNDVVS